jgi:hypothetical protein
MTNLACSLHAGMNLEPDTKPAFPTIPQGLVIALATASLIPAWWLGFQYWHALLVHNPFAGLFGVFNIIACATSAVMALSAGLLAYLLRAPTKLQRGVWTAAAFGQVPTVVVLLHWFF